MTAVLLGPLVNEAHSKYHVGPSLMRSCLDDVEKHISEMSEEYLVSEPFLNSHADRPGMDFLSASSLDSVSNHSLRTNQGQYVSETSCTTSDDGSLDYCQLASHRNNLPLDPYTLGGLQILDPDFPMETRIPPEDVDHGPVRDLESETCLSSLTYRSSVQSSTSVLEPE